MIKKIDEVTRQDHFYLEESDNCYYFGEYTSGTSFNHSPTNQLISNFKKPITVKGTNQWRYKLEAIDKVAYLFKNNITFSNPENIVLVPIPPSKMKTHPEYDDRISQVITKFNVDSIYDFKEIVTVIENMPSFHQSDGNRKHPNELIKNLQLDKQLCENLKSTVVLIDDVITTGSHFKACQNLIQNKYPTTHVIGIFIARRNFDTQVN